MKYINSIDIQEMQFVICAYHNTMIYHDYDYKEKRLSAGKPLTVETTKELFKFVNDLGGNYFNFGKDIIPNNVLKFSTDQRSIIWTTKSEIKNLLYQKKLPVKTGKYWIPSLVWKLEDTRLQVFALKTNTIKNTTELFQAPFFNVNSEGNVCMGNTKFVDDSSNYIKIMKKVEEGFFNSVFTHTNTDNLLTCNFTEWANGVESRLDSRYLLIDIKHKIKDIL